MKKLIKFFANVYLVCGILSSLIYSTAYKGTLETKIGIFVAILFSSVLIFALLNAIYQHLENQDDILYYLENIFEKLPEKNNEAKNTWKCKKCGHENPDYTGTCSCGNIR